MMKSAEKWRRQKAKIDDLMNGEVSSGKLTSDQATELPGRLPTPSPHF
jgi:hypothetical protein